jgi:hypothetical protein
MIPISVQSATPIAECNDVIEAIVATLFATTLRQGPGKISITSDFRHSGVLSRPTTMFRRELPRAKESMIPMRARYPDRVPEG